MRVVIPLRERPLDVALVVFYVINLVLVSYVIDIEQLVIADPYDFEYPLWPPRAAVDLIHWWGETYDPALMARPPWWKATIWIDQLLFGPFYAFAIYAYIKGKEWIRLPSVIWASVMWTNVFIILNEEVCGPHATDQLAMVLAANASWFLVPIVVIWRMWRGGEHPFTRPAAEAESGGGAAEVA